MFVVVTCKLGNKQAFQDCSCGWCLTEGYRNGDQRRPMGPCGSGRTLAVLVLQLHAKRGLIINSYQPQVFMFHVCLLFNADCNDDFTVTTGAESLHSNNVCISTITVFWLQCRYSVTWFLCVGKGIIRSTAREKGHNPHQFRLLKIFGQSLKFGQTLFAVSMLV